MRVKLNKLNEADNKNDKVLFLEVNKTLEKSDKKNAIRNGHEKNSSSENNLITKNEIEKSSEQFVLESSQNGEHLSATADGNDLEIFCCNLTSADKNEHTILLHVDYWRKQAKNKTTL